MLSVQAPIEHGRQEIFSEQNSIQEQDEIPMEMPTKQQLKKQVITPTRVLIAVAILCILALGSYKVYTIAFPATTESKMDLTHSKIISVAESSSGKDTNSNSGSQSSKSSQDSGKPIGVAKTVGKDVISSNIQGGSGNGGDDKDPN
jgi:cytoskeletal protein RodZ